MACAATPVQVLCPATIYGKQPAHCHVMRSPEECMLKIAETINRAHKVTSTVCVVLENVAGGVGITSSDTKYPLTLS